MYIAMNRFKIALGREEDFIQIWRERDSHLHEVPGFKSFNLLQGATHEDHTLFTSHSTWDSEADFIAWTKSEAFRKAHASASPDRTIYLGPPQFEGFKAVL
ncbi:antibiotic biosynthesis monooxygenase [Terasakiispira papahanaumokuakeensis]|uniref:Antibiotic biosynthesis monooxygenase n=1 Tax=Terasakiispira papahanaumokuakeensis TaxID=197479 RepID=A0A1E2V8Y3_9GAMM|nr:antibiotic biosynthesis monooxygenase [Terasakiispira papahanaumokuakeensis]ODC03451.1 antibiotic biosynthesis monooxygenase [Terasakiispira papahanaumokuakeensis]